MHGSLRGTAGWSVQLVAAKGVFTAHKLNYSAFVALANLRYINALNNNNNNN